MRVKWKNHEIKILENTSWVWVALIVIGVFAFAIGFMALLAAGFLWALSVFGIAQFPIDAAHIFAFWVIFIVVSSLFRGLISLNSTNNSFNRQG